jgi:hypothetical protein
MSVGIIRVFVGRHHSACYLRRFSFGKEIIDLHYFDLAIMAESSVYYRGLGTEAPNAGDRPSAEL